MTLYIVQRFAAVVGVIVLMSVLVFLATHAMPASIAEVMLGQYATPETVAALEAKLGLTRPLFTQYWEWASSALRGDLGRSLVMEVPIAPVLWTALGRSAVIGAAAMTVVSALGIALGVVAAVRRGRMVDRLASGFTIVGLSVPEFFWGLLLILLFGSYLRLFPTSGYGTLQQGAASYVAHLVLPVLTLTVGLLAHVARLTRSSVLAAVIIGALGADWLAPYPFDEMHIADRLHGPSLAYLAGTDEYGRDVLSRTLYGARLSLFLGFVATVIGLVAGVPLGLLAGYRR